MWVVGIFFLLPFPAWQLMVGYITSVTVMTYGLGPVVLLVMRRSQPDIERPFKLKGAFLLAPLAFICSNWIIYWTGFATNSFLFLLIAIGFVIYALYYHFVARRPVIGFGWRNIDWLFAWFGGMWLISALGDIDGGYGLLGFWSSAAVIAVWSLVVLALALRSAIPAAETAELMVEMEKIA
jgi:hypothetical protein